MFSEFYDKSGESDKNLESGRQRIKSGESRSNQEGWNLWVSFPAMAKVRSKKISKLNYFVKCWLITQGSKKDCNFQLVLWASSFNILLAHLLVSVYDLIRGWFSWTIAHWASKLEKLVNCPARKPTCLGYRTFLEPCNMKERFHLYVHTTEFCCGL